MFCYHENIKSGDCNLRPTHMSTITKLSPGVTQYYNNIASLIGAIARIQRDIQV